MQLHRPATAGRDVRTELQRKEHELSNLRMTALRALEQQVSSTCSITTQTQHSDELQHQPVPTQHMATPTAVHQTLLCNPCPVPQHTCVSFAAG